MFRFPIGKALQGRWKNLRDRYAKEVKLQREAPSGSGRRKKTPYVYTARMSFLNDVMQFRTTANSLEKDGDLLNEMPQQREVGSSPTGGSSVTPESRPFGKKRRLDPVEAKIVAAIEANTAARKLQQPQNEDDDLHFLMSLLSTVKSVPPHLKMKCRLDVMQVIMKYSGPDTQPTASTQTFRIPHEKLSEKFSQPPNSQFQPILHELQVRPHYEYEPSAIHISPPTSISQLTYAATPTPNQSPSPLSAASYISSYTDDNDSQLSIF